MTNKTFPLTKNLILPIQGDDLSNGAYLFVAGSFGLSYENFRPQPEQKVLNLDLVVRRLDTNATVHRIKSFYVTENGTPTSTVVNDVEYNKYLADKASLQEKVTAANTAAQEQRVIVEALRAEINSATPEEKPKLEIELAAETTKLNQLDSAVMKANSDLWNLKPVMPEYEHILPYREVIAWFNNEGLILEDSLEDAMNIPFGNGKISDYIK